MAVLTIPWSILLLLLSSILLCFTPCPAQEYTFDIDEIEKKAFQIGGYAEFNPILFWLDKDASFYKLSFYDRDEGSTLEKYDMSLQLDASYEKGIARTFFRINGNLNHTYEGWSGKTTLYEGFLSLKPSPSLTVDMGKKTLKWGKGYAWNPVAFLDRPRDPDDPTLALEGYFVATLDYIKSFDGALRTISLTPAILPVYGDINKDFGKTGYLNFAAKIYFLFLDTDIDIIFLSKASKSSSYGIDFSRNITSNFEIHGEAAWIRDFRKGFLDTNGKRVEDHFDAWKYLIGIRYLTARETTYILEYYYNGTGFTETEMANFFSFINKGYDTFALTGNDDLLNQASGLSRGGYGKKNPMRKYLYLRVSQKEPFDILYFTPSLTWIFNLDDQSFSISPEMVYTGFNNLELRFRAALLSGERYSEYKEKQNDYRMEFRARYYF